MRFHVVHKLMSYLLAVAAVGTLLSTGTVPLPTTVLLMVTGVLSWFVEPGTFMGKLLGRAGLVFNVGALAFFALSLFDVIRSFPEPDLTPILNLVLFLLVYKLYHRRSNRDYLQLYILSFLVVLAGAWLAQTVLFVAGFAAYVVLATWTLILFHLRHEIEDNYLVKHLPESATEKVTAARVLNSRRVVGRSFFVTTGLVSLAVLAGAGLVFASIPRIGLGFLSGSVRRRMSFVGFSDQVRLGQHGVLSKENDTVVLRVQVPRIAAIADDRLRERTISQLYWRGVVFDRYVPPTGRPSDSDDSDQSTWTTARAETTRNIPKRFPTFDGGNIHFVVSRQAPERKGAFEHRKIIERADMQVIQVVGLSFPVAFALDRPVAYEMKPPPLGSFVTTDFIDKWSGEVALRPVRLASSGNYQPLPDFSGGQYVAYSRLEGGDGGKPLSEVPPADLAPYLELPPLSQRVIDKAREITAGKALPMAKVIAVIEWLKRTHRYTTDLKRDPSVVDPLEDFLFTQSAGHCEYFASAAAILLRISGVPTRYINGFLGGEWNSLSKHITVAQNRAHSWVEAYLGTAGWVRVDATPVVARLSRMGRVRQVFDSVELFWSRWVIQYDASRQIDLAKRLGRQLGMDRASSKRNKSTPVNRKAIAAGVAAAVAALVAWRLRRRFRRRPTLGAARVPRGGPPIFRLYHRTVDRLAARGWPRQPSETPTEFAARVAEAAVPGADVLTELTRHYAAARYGAREVPDAVLAALASQADLVGRPKRAAAA